MDNRNGKPSSQPDRFEILKGIFEDGLAQDNSYETLLSGFVETDAQDDEEAANQKSDTPVFDARALTGTGQLAYILLDGQTYTLRITRQQKLILTK